MVSSWLKKIQGGIIDEDEENVKRKLASVIRRASGVFTLLLCIDLVFVLVLINHSASFPDAQKAAEDMQSFARMNEQRLYKLMKTCMDPQTDLKGLVKSMVCKNLISS